MSTATLIRPPQQVAPLPAGSTATAGVANYEAHPAYAPLLGTASIGERIAALFTFAKSYALILVKRLIRYEMIPLDVRDPLKPGFYRAALGNVFGPSRPRGGIRVDGMAAGVLDELQRTGVAVVGLDGDDLAALERHSQPGFRHLEERRARTAGGQRSFDDSRHYLRRAEAPQLFAGIEAALARAGAMEAASAYLGRPVRLVDVNPQINDVSDNFWARIFPDLPELPHPATAYFHRDASGGDLKAIIYLSDVGPEQGPFEYVLGSQQWLPGRWLDYACEANDSNGLADTSPERRRRFAALPAAVRVKGAFGNDLLDSSQESRLLTGSRWTITAARGSVVLFDTKGIHRGGMVQQGERRVITCVLG